MNILSKCMTYFRTGPLTNFGFQVDTAAMGIHKWISVSGVILIMCLLILLSASTRGIRYGHNSLFFWKTHYVSILFYVVLLFHGNTGFSPNFWKCKNTIERVFSNSMIDRVYSNVPHFFLSNDI